MDLLFIAAAAVLAGAINALAGGGTLITFPALIFTGIPPVFANVTSTVALCPGYLGASFSQRDHLRGQESRLLLCLPAAAVGGILGGWLLLYTGGQLFRKVVPFLILLGALLIAVQERIHSWLKKRSKSSLKSEKALPFAIAIAAIYGGYFGAGLGVIVLAVLDILLEDSLTRLNALKQEISLMANIAAAIFFIFFSRRIIWPAAIVMAAGALGGGVIGGLIANKVKPAILRWTVVMVGIIIAIVFFITWR